MTKKLTIIAFLRAKPGQEDELGRRLLELVETSRSEPGCLNYDVHRDQRDPAVYAMYENWRSAADLDEHFATAPLQRFLADRELLVEGGFDMHYLSMVSTTA